MTELLREKFVSRQDRTRKKFRDDNNDPIRVSFYDLDGKKVSDVTRKEANKIAQDIPLQLFYFQDGGGVLRELNIDQVNNLQKNDLKRESPCNTSLQSCGPPYLNIFGGNGFGAFANPIISPTSSSPIAFDIISGGKNYTSPPFAQLIDTCGKGSGSKLETEISNGSVSRIIIKSPGDGYLSAPDGSLGANETTIIKSIGQPSVPVYNAILEIEDIDIINPGFGYKPGDKIIVTPSRGSVLEPVIDKGRIIGVNIINSGIGFDDFPEITTDSSTGYNFSSRPIFKVRRLDEINEETKLILSSGATIISVVDCVGKISPKTEFDRIPR